MTRFRKIFLVLLSLSVGGCGFTSPSTFYALDNAPVPAQTGRLTTQSAPLIGIEPVFVPPYLDKPQIIERDADSPVVKVDEFNRWAEMLSDTFPRILAKAVNQKAKRVLAKPVGSLRGDYPYRLYIEIERFDASFGKQAVLEAWMTVMNGSPTPVTVNKIVLTEPVGGTFDDMVRAQNALIYRLGDMIAGYALKNLRK